MKIQITMMTMQPNACLADDPGGTRGSVAARA